MVFFMVLRPKSRGHIALQSSNPFDYPRIYANYLDDPYDLDIAIKGIRKMIDLIHTKAFQQYDAKFFDTQSPGCEGFTFNTDEYWECHTRLFPLTIYHHAGTCKMGAVTDKTAVVDHRLRVHGIKELRVIDASIMPAMVAGHPNGSIMMIAEKASDMIKADWK
jgi:choline dehydrogenase-like flavoprotein